MPPSSSHILTIYQPRGIGNNIILIGNFHNLQRNIDPSRFSMSAISNLDNDMTKFLDEQYLLGLGQIDPELKDVSCYPDDITGNPRTELLSA